MGEVLKIGFGAALVCAAVTTAIFVARALLSREQTLLGGERARDETWLTKVNTGAVFVGWFAIVQFGVQGLLFWLPRSWEEGIFSLALFAALGSIYLLLQIERLPRMRREIEVEATVSTWVLKELRNLNTPPSATVERLKYEAADTTKTAIEREIAATKSVFADALKKRDEQLEAQILQRMQREHAAEFEQVKLDRQEKETQAAKQCRMAYLDSSLKALVQQLPTTSDPMAMEHGAEAVVDFELQMGSWTLFKDIVVSTLPSSEVDAAASQQHLEANLLKLPGVNLPSGVRVAISFSGSERDGFCDAVAFSSGNQKPLGEVLRYDDSLQGILAAFFFAAALQRKWSWGHGRYDRDHVLLATEDEIKDALGDADLPQQANATWPPAGVRVLRLHDGYVLSCLSTRPGGGLFDLSIEVHRGSASPLRVREVLKSSRRVLYA